jgi:hypothetical protein
VITLREDADVHHAVCWSSADAVVSRCSRRYRERK